MVQGQGKGHGHRRKHALSALPPQKADIENDAAKAESATADISFVSQSASSDSELTEACARGRERDEGLL